MNDNDKNGRPETLADIVREMRTILSVMPEGSGDVHIPKHWLEEWADCIEAALKQKRDAAPGNAAAMREALVRCATLGEFCFQDIHTEVAKIARAALAKPPRNCDVGTAEEQNRRYERFCDGNFDHNDPDARCGGCPLGEADGCILAWAQMPYEAEKGGAE